MDEHSVNRRQWLKATGAGAGIAFVGTTGAMRSRTAGDSYQPEFTTMNDAEEIADCETEIQQLLFAFDADSEDDEPIEVEPGEEFDEILDEFDVDLEPEGRVFEDGTWELDPIDVIIDDPEGSLDTLFDLLEEFGDGDFDFDPSDIEDFIGGIDGFVEIRLGNQDDATQPIDGIFNPQNEIVTADLKLSAVIDLTIDLDVPIFDPDDIEVDLDLEVEATLTTEESGEMDGSYEEVADDELQLELVANDFLVPETNTVIVLDLPDIPGVDLPVPDQIDIDEEAGLPSPAGRNFLRLTLDVFFDPEIPELLGGIEGTVIDPAQNPLEDASVEIVNPITGATVTADELITDDEGRYSLDTLAAGPYDVFVERENYRSASERVPVLAEKVAEPQTVLEEDTTVDIATINGTVIDENDNPVPGFELEAVNTADDEIRETAVTNEDGEFSLTIRTTHTDPNRDEMVHILGSRDGYRELKGGNTEGSSVSVSPADIINHNIQLELLQGSIEGRVREDMNGVPFIEVEAIDRQTGELVDTTETDSDGLYTHTLIPGAYDIRAEREDGAEFNKVATVGVSAEADATKYGVDLDLEIPPAVVQGTVTYEDEGVPNVVLNAVADGNSEGGDISGQDGTFEFDVPHGEYTISASGEIDGTPASATESVTLDPEDTLDLELALEIGPKALIPYDKPPKDLNDDGLFEAVRGDEELTIADVQAFFTAIQEDDPALIEGPEFFNFSGLNPDEVTIFDVQALFNRLENKDTYDIPE